MAHFARLGPGNVVEQVIVVDNRDTSDANGIEKEHIGAAFVSACWVVAGYRPATTATSARTTPVRVIPMTSSVMRSSRPSLSQAGC
jgi:hypothetical protein